jgi:hypothetical protein
LCFVPTRIEAHSRIPRKSESRKGSHLAADNEQLSENLRRFYALRLGYVRLLRLGFL